MSQKRQQFQVAGMHCVSCAMALEGALEDLPGVGRADVSYAKAQATIEYDAERISEAQLQAAAQAVGYTLQA